ncbi:MAG: hypothetical protein IT368_06700 [Candidatus Hydrogenedentes bacterium]|nr:hypothetical protein [Candidatus Hydrogenedentota bacterium]
MPTLIATTVVRHSLASEPSGFVYTIDAETKQITGRSPIVEPPHRDRDPNTTGGLRGGRGLFVLGDEIFIANNSAVYRYDKHWNLLSTISHPLCANVHDVAVRGDSMWMTCSGNDLLLELDLQGNARGFWYAREDADRMSSLKWETNMLYTRQDFEAGEIDFRDPDAFEMTRSDGGHVNSVALLPDGRTMVMIGLMWSRRFNFLYRVRMIMFKLGLWKHFRNAVRRSIILMGRKPAANDLGIAVAKAQSAIVMLDRNKQSPRVLRVIPDAHVPTHSLLLGGPHRAFYANSSTGVLVEFDPETGATRQECKIGEVFLRGLALLGSDQLVAGDQQDLCFVDWSAPALQHRLRLTENPKESIYDVKVLPAGSDPIPPRLQGEIVQTLPRKEKSASTV